MIEVATLIVAIAQLIYSIVSDQHQRDDPDDEDSPER